jgi:outer membrane protein OmpA-like peptidoglycan-associated protein
MNFKRSLALTITIAVMGANSAFASPSYPPRPGVDPEYQAVIGFKSGSDSFEKKYMKQLEELEIDKKATVTIQGYTSQGRNSKSDSKLARERAENTLKRLRSISSKAKYVVKSEGSTYTALCVEFNNNCVVVTVRDKS